MSLRGFSSENRGRAFSKDQSQRHDTSAPAFATLVRPSHAQAPAVLDHSRTLPQCDGGAGPAFAGGAEGSERDPRCQRRAPRCFRRQGSTYRRGR